MTEPFGEDRDLASRCVANAPGAFDVLYERHASRLFALSVRMVGRQDAEDVLQEIFVTAYRRLGSYRGDSALGTWLFRLATNVCLDHLRRVANRPLAASDTLDAEADAEGREGPILGVVDRMDLERAVAALPAKSRAVFVLHDIEGLGHGEIASLMGIAEGTSKSQLHKARLKLRADLAPARRVEQPA